MFIIPMPMPIIVPVVRGSGGHGVTATLNGMLIMILIAALIVYYVMVVCSLSFNDYRSKKEFLKALIPFSRTVKWCKGKWNSLEDGDQKEEEKPLPKKLFD